MHEHRDIELTGLEGAAYVLQMHADFFETVFVPGRLRGDLNGATVFTQHKMMRGLLLVKAHALIAAVLHFLVFGVVWLLSGRATLRVHGRHRKCC